jgi:hypothetical protein
VEHAGVRLAIAICAEARFDAPSDAAAAAGAGLVLFPAAPGLYGRRTSAASWRDGFAWWEGCALGDARRHARRGGLWIALAGQAGSTEDEDFPGLAAVVSPAGTVTGRLPDWQPGTLVADVPLGADGGSRPLPAGPVPRPAGPGRMDGMADADGRPRQGGGVAAPPADLIVIAAAIIEQGRLLVAGPGRGDPGHPVPAAHRPDARLMMAG